MRYEEIKTKSDGEFKRLTGVSHQMFEKMLAVLEREWRAFGRPPELSRADQLLVTLLYWREYRTQFHLGVDFGVSESTVSRTINKVEDLLIQSGEFRLPGKKELHGPETKVAVIIVDATEQQIERPKKSKSSTIAANKGATRTKHKLLSTSTP